MTKEQELLKAINQAEEDKDKAKDTMAKHKKAWVEAETDLIEAKIRKDRLLEELRVYRASHVPVL